MDCLAPRALFFRGGPKSLQAIGFLGEIEFLDGVVVFFLAWLLLSLLFVIAWPFLSSRLFGPRNDEEDDIEQTEYMKRWQARQWFRENQRRKRKGIKP